MEKAAPSDEDLVSRTQGGDEAAFRALVDRYRERLVAAAARRLPPTLRARVSASDIVQDCVLAAHGRLGDFEDRGPGSFGRWIRGILENKVRDQVRDHLVRARRSANRDVRVDSRSDAGPVADGSRTPGSLLATREQGALLRAALSHLPEDQRGILRLVHEGGLSVAQAAEQMGRTRDAGRKLYSRGIASLAKAVRARSPRPS